MARFGRYSSTDYMEKAPGAALGFMELMQREKATEGRQAIMKTQAETGEGHLKLAQDKFAAEIPAPLKPFKESELTIFKSKVEKEFGSNLVRAAEPIFNTIENLKGQGGNKLDTLRLFTSDWQRHVKPLKEGLQKLLAGAVDREKVDEIDKYSKAVDAVSDEKFIETLLPETAKFEKDLQKETPELTMGKPFTEVVDGGTQRSVPVYDDKLQLLHKVDLGEPYISKTGKGGSGGKPTDFEKAYYQHNARTKENLSRAKFRKKHWLSNPAIGQEMVSLRQDRAHIKRESSVLRKKVAKAKKFPDIDMYQREAESAKEQLELYDLELKDLKTREGELLGKAPKKESEKTKEMSKMPPASKHKDRPLRDTKTGDLYISDGKTWVKQ